MHRTKWTAHKICKLRTAMRMSQHQFALAVGCAGGQAVSRWERGLCEPCTEFQIAMDNLLAEHESTAKGEKP